MDTERLRWLDHGKEAVVDVATLVLSLSACRRVTGIEEKPNIVKFILAGIYIMRPEIFEMIPTDTYFGMDLLIKAMLKRGAPVVKYNLEAYWLDIGQITDFEKAQDIYRQHFKED